MSKFTDLSFIFERYIYLLSLIDISKWNILNSTFLVDIHYLFITDISKWNIVNATNFWYSRYFKLEYNEYDNSCFFLFQNR